MAGSGALLMAAMCAALTGLTVAHAQAADDPVTADLTVGHQALDRGDQQAAYRAYRRAFSRHIRYDTAANLGLLEADLGKRGEAATHLSIALERFPPAGDTAIRGQLVQQLDQLEGALGEVQLDTRARGAEVHLDGSHVGMTPLPGPLFVEPGEHELSLHAGGVHAASKATVTAGSKQRIYLELAGEDPGAPTLANGYVAVVVVGGTLSAAAVSVGSALLYGAHALDATANDQIDELVRTAGSKDCRSYPELCEEISAGQSQRDQHAIGGIIAMAAGGVLAAGTIVYGVVADASPAAVAAPETAMVSPWIAPEGAFGVVLDGRF